MHVQLARSLGRLAAAGLGEPCTGALYTHDGLGYEIFVLSGGP